MSQPRYLSSAEACRVIGIDRSTLSRWVQIGKATPAMQLPGDTGAFLFDPDEVDRLAQTYVKAAS